MAGATATITIITDPSAWIPSPLGRVGPTVVIWLTWAGTWEMATNRGSTHYEYQTLAHALNDTSAYLEDQLAVV